MEEGSGGWQAGPTTSSQSPSPSPPPPQCGSLTGWRRVVELYSGHWDAVTTVATPWASQDVVTAVHAAALCSSPLVLNSFGAVVQVGGAPCLSGWAPAPQLGGPCRTHQDSAWVRASATSYFPSFCSILKTASAQRVKRTNQGMPA